MTGRKKKVFKAAAVFGLLLVVILLGTAIQYSSISRFNNTERVYVPGQSGDLWFSMARRTGSTDTWNKTLYDDGSAEGRKYRAVIYDATLSNRTDYKLTDWKWTVRFDTPCYINNAWCGSMEFHQGDKVQEIDLRNYREADITLEHLMSDSDLMIPMAPGQYMVYVPSGEFGELPINAADLKEEKYQGVTIGFIVYFLEGTEVDFGDCEITYHLETSFWKEKTSWGCLLALLIWCVSFVIFVIAEIGITIAYRRFRRDERIIRQSLDVFTTFFDAKDPYTNGHSKRVAEYAGKIAKKLKFSEEECNKVFYVGLMHDCGKCYIPDSILKKPGKLTQEEFDIIKSHTVRGAEMLKDFDAVENIKEGALYHHERYDGKGYPEGKKGEEIPLIARIICVADAFDAMNSSRCYRGRLSKEKIISELQENSGRQFDPRIVKCMLELIEEGSVEIEPAASS